MDAGKRSISDIFNGYRVLEIPFFQRAYVWGEDQWQRMLEDMETVTQLNRPYFMGSVILKQQETRSDSEVGDIRTLIDGQQRLTTLNILIKVLCLKTKNNTAFDRLFRLESNKLALWHNHNDEKAFDRVLALSELDSLEGGDNITLAYEYFRKKLVPENIDRQKLLRNIVFVGIDLSKDEDEQQIFDTINSLGVRLTTAELLKNHLFDREELDMYDVYWKSVFEKDGITKEYWDNEVTTGRTKRTFIDLFFYAYLQIKIQNPSLKVRTEEKLEYSKVDNLFESYKRFIKNYNLTDDKRAFLKEIKEYAEAFKKNFDHSIIHKELPAEYGIERVNAIIFGLETSTLIPYVLYILKNVHDDDQRNELFEFIESYIMRRIVTKANNRNYNQLFTDRLISNGIQSKKQLKEFLTVRDDKVNHFPDNTDLKHGFDNNVLINIQAAGVIYFLESHIRDRSRHATHLLGLKKYSLEHLMPKKWENQWSMPSSQEEKDYRNKKLKTLGNLAIITQSLNAAIRDSDWATKKDGRGKKFGLSHYSSGIETLFPYLNLSDWDEEQIEKRAEDLYQMALEVWDYGEVAVENKSMHKEM